MPRPLCQAYSTTPLRRLQRHPQSALDENPVYRDAVLGLKHEKTQCHPRGQACSIAPDILPAAVVDENPCPRDTAVVWRVYKGEVRPGERDVPWLEGCALARGMCPGRGIFYVC